MMIFRRGIDMPEKVGLYAVGVILSVAGAYLEWHLAGALLAAGIAVAVFVVNL